MLVANALTMCSTMPEDEDIAFARLFLSRYSEIEKQILLHLYLQRPLHLQHLQHLLRAAAAAAIAMPIAFHWNWLLCGGACFLAQTPDMDHIGQPVRRAANAIRRHQRSSSSPEPDEENP
ncbi:hypothetical protein HYH02_012946 [Chlamydomonas schloesseri]|uniref:Uncharacterized protein n=1 Tax=Chlamydomonas schloesseri TaxID=2026947 RepID=A0A835W074_9CHLO|nr:hypothetical protein HYH02_012946 [Chlamydomonas schloesseri]|eukprot:KAG2432373.1 hypothetical protein HYH02_012946 [Chlamydomonas schloesseri]